MFSPVASGIFAFRNADKTQNGEIGRSAVALGQTAGVIQEIAKYDNIAANCARSTISVFTNLAKQNKAFEYAGKVTKFAVNNVNPLICVSSGIKTAMSDDKIGTGITEISALSTMFAGEHLIKSNYDNIANSRTVQKGLQKLSETKYLNKIFEFIKNGKHSGKIGMFIKGLLFVAGSMTSYTIGQKVGKKVAKDVKAELGIKDKPKSKKIDQKT